MMFLSPDELIFLRQGFDILETSLTATEKNCKVKTTSKNSSRLRRVEKHRHIRMMNGL